MFKIQDADPRPVQADAATQSEGYRPLTHAARPLRQTVDTFSHMIPSNNTRIHSPKAPALPQRKVAYPLIQALGYKHAYSQLSDYRQVMLNDRFEPAFWQDFLSHNEKCAQELFGTYRPHHILVLSEDNITELKARAWKPETVSQFIYWLLTSEQGPGIMVAYSADVAQGIKAWLKQNDVRYYSAYIAFSRFELAIKNKHPAALVVQERLAPAHGSTKPLTRSPRAADLQALGATDA